MHSPLEAAIGCVAGLQTANGMNQLRRTTTGSRGNGFHINKKLKNGGRTMSGVSTKLGSLLGYASIIVLDEDERTRSDLRDRLSVEFPEASVLGFAVEADAREHARQADRRSCIFVVAHSWYCAASLPGLLDELPDSDTFLLYGDHMTADDIRGAVQSGAFTGVSNADVESAVHGVFIADELARAKTGAPAADAILNGANMGISILSPQMDVLWMNDRTSQIVDDASSAHRQCWLRYHGFMYREWACPTCTANEVLRKALDALGRGDAVENFRLTREHLLPVAKPTEGGWQRKIERVEVNAAPLMSHDGKRVFAVIEATRFITEQWEEQTPAHRRLLEVIEMARKLGRQSEAAQLAEAVSVYYRPEGTAHFHLFDSAADDRDAVAKLLRLPERHEAYSQVVEEEGHRFFVVESEGRVCRHFVWAGRSPSMDYEILIDVAYSDEKPEGLLTEDLRPYWEYVVDVFAQAWADREDEITRNIDGAFQGFADWTTVSIQDEDSLDRAIEVLVQCVQDAIDPFSMYIRIFDHASGIFVKRGGFGPYCQIAPNSRALQFGGIGSSEVAETRGGVWCKDEDVSTIGQHLDREPTDDELQMLGRISSHVTLPLTSGDRVLGTLCIQFEDDSLFSDAKCQFIRTMMNALGTMLGNRHWALERAAIIRRSHELDATMFDRSRHPEEEETLVIANVMRMVFELTAAELVAFYRYDDQTRKLHLVSDSVQGCLPKDTRMATVLDDGVGIVGLAAQTRDVHRAEDFRGGDWQGVRDSLLQTFSPGPERRFCEWIGSVIAAPVIADSFARGVLVAFSSIPRWLNKDDKEVVRELAFKTGLWLAAKDLTRRLNWYDRTRISLNRITGWMARISDVDILYRSYLMAVTAEECLGFNRAVLFRCIESDGTTFVVTDAIGQCSLKEARARWKEARHVSLTAKMEACQEPLPIRDGDVANSLDGLRIDLGAVPAGVLAALSNRKTVVRRRGEPHLIDDGVYQGLRAKGGNDDPEYVLMPIWVRGELVALVYADRPFLPPAELEASWLELTELLAGEFVLMLDALKLREEKHKTSIAEDLARGISYTLRTRAAGLEARILNLPEELRREYPDEIAGLREAVQFFDRAGTNATNILRIEEIAVGDAEPVSVGETIDETVAFLRDGRIVTRGVDRSIQVRTERQLLVDTWLELLWNACEFTDKEDGKIVVSVRREGTNARIDISDNGPGIRPNFRPYLFERFKCYPLTRMGLGLSYARSLVEACGGLIDEIGARQEGAHFVVKIPLMEEDEND